MMRNMPDFTWNITPKGKRLVRQRLVFFDISAHALGYAAIRSIVA